MPIKALIENALKEKALKEKNPEEYSYDGVRRGVGWHQVYFNHKQSGEGVVDLGLKIHVGLDHGKYEKAIEALLPVLMNQEYTFKIHNNPEKKWENNEFGKELCIYIPPGADSTTLLNFVEKIESTLKENNIPPSEKPPTADRIIPGSNYNIGYRFDTADEKMIAKHNMNYRGYIAANFAVENFGSKAYNPVEYQDPLAEIVLLNNTTSLAASDRRISPLEVQSASHAFHEWRKEYCKAIDAQHALIPINTKGLHCKTNETQIFLTLSQCAQLSDSTIKDIQNDTDREKVKSLKNFFSSLQDLEGSFLEYKNYQYLLELGRVAEEKYTKLYNECVNKLEVCNGLLDRKDLNNFCLSKPADSATTQKSQSDSTSTLETRLKALLDWFKELFNFTQLNSIIYCDDENINYREKNAVEFCKPNSNIAPKTKSELVDVSQVLKARLQEVKQAGNLKNDSLDNEKLSVPNQHQSTP